MIPDVVAGLFGVPLGYQQLTLTGSAQSLPSIPSGATMALIVAGADAITWRDDGTPPTTTVGMPLIAGASLLYGSALENFQLIGTSGGTVNISYYQ